MISSSGSMMFTSLSEYHATLFLSTHQTIGLAPEVIKGANHIIVLNNPEELEKSIENFLKRINFI